MNGADKILPIVVKTSAMHEMLPEESATPVVLMVSGGSDSLALAHILPSIHPHARYTILHVNHGLRGQEADADERFVENFARVNNLAYEVVHLDIAAIAAHTGENIEQCGREERYKAAGELLDRLCEQSGISSDSGRIAVAHTLDDRVETFFMRAIVGGGATGLSSIPYVNGRIIRPLLDCSRDELRQYLVDLHQSTSQAERESGEHLWCEDASNYDTQGFRAFVRHELIPLATTRNPRLLETVGRNLGILAEEDAYLESLAKQIGAETLTWDPDGAIRLDIAVLEQPKPLARRIVRNVCNLILPKSERITFAHVNLITDHGQRVGFVTTLPGNVTVKNECDTLTFLPETVKKTRALDIAQKVDQEWELAPGRKCLLPDGRVITLKKLDKVDYGDDALAYAREQAKSRCIYVDGEKLEATLKAENGCLVVTGIRTGDILCPLGMRGKHKLVSDVLIDRKIPAYERPDIKIVRTGQTIIWIVGVQQDDRFKVTPQSNTMFRIELTEPTKG